MSTSWFKKVFFRKSTKKKNNIIAAASDAVPSNRVAAAMPAASRISIKNSYRKVLDSYSVDSEVQRMRGKLLIDTDLLKKQQSDDGGSLVKSDSLNKEMASIRQELKQHDAQSSLGRFWARFITNRSIEKKRAVYVSYQADFLRRDTLGPHLEGSLIYSPEEVHEFKEPREQQRKFAAAELAYHIPKLSFFSRIKKAVIAVAKIFSRDITAFVSKVVDEKVEENKAYKVEALKEKNKKIQIELLSLSTTQGSLIKKIKDLRYELKISYLVNSKPYLEDQWETDKKTRNWLQTTISELKKIHAENLANFDASVNAKIESLLPVELKSKYEQTKLQLTDIFTKGPAKPVEQIMELRNSLITHYRELTDLSWTSDDSFKQVKIELQRMHEEDLLDFDAYVNANIKKSMVVKLSSNYQATKAQINDLFTKGTVKSAGQILDLRNALISHYTDTIKLNELSGSDDVYSQAIKSELKSVHEQNLVDFDSYVDVMLKNAKVKIIRTEAALSREKLEKQYDKVAMQLRQAFREPMVSSAELIVSLRQSLVSVYTDLVQPYVQSPGFALQSPEWANVMQESVLKIKNKIQKTHEKNLLSFDSLVKEVQKTVGLQPSREAFMPFEALTHLFIAQAKKEYGLAVEKLQKLYATESNRGGFLAQREEAIKDLRRHHKTVANAFELAFKQKFGTQQPELRSWLKYQVEEQGELDLKHFMKSSKTLLEDRIEEVFQARMAPLAEKVRSARSKHLSIQQSPGVLDPTAWREFILHQQEVKDILAAFENVKDTLESEYRYFNNVTEVLERKREQCLRSSDDRGFRLFGKKVEVLGKHHQLMRRTLDIDYFDGDYVNMKKMDRDNSDLFTKNAHLETVAEVAVPAPAYPQAMMA